MPVSMNTIVFMDLETTGLLYSKPKMTEISCVGVSVGDILGKLIIHFYKVIIMSILDLGLEIDEFKEDNPSVDKKNEFLKKLESIQPRVINKLTMALNPGKPIHPKVREALALI